MDDAKDKVYDLLIIGGGVNGCGIARDAAGRGLSVMLAEQNDLASGTSSASTKLLHGGLRYLEYFKFRLVREALQESERLLSAMPHISFPMRFILPVDQKQRPAWYLRLGLMVYDQLGRRRILPGTKVLNPRQDSAGVPLKTKFKKAFEYSDCWVDDSRLVVLNARDAKNYGAEIKTRTKVEAAKPIEQSGLGKVWSVDLQTIDGKNLTVYAKVLINAAGPWVGEVLHKRVKLPSNENIRLVRGSHIVVNKLFNHNRAYTLQGKDGRVVFAIPYQDDFTLIGTTDIDHQSGLEDISCSSIEEEYLCRFVSEYFSAPVKKRDIIWKYAGVRPLFDDGNQSATDTTRDYVLSLNTESGAPIVNIFGGKITTYRKLAETVLEKLKAFFPHMDKPWTAGASLPGGAFPLGDVESIIAEAKADYRFLSAKTIKRLFRCYGTDLWQILANAKAKSELGRDFGGDLTEAEVKWLRVNEFAITADDILWRRTKLGLRFNRNDTKVLESWLLEN